MKKWINRTVAVELLGFVMGRAAFFSMNPIGIGYFICTKEMGNHIVTAAMVLLGMATGMEAVDVVKYALAMAAISVMETMFRMEGDGRRAAKKKQAAAGGIVVAALSMTKAFLYKDYIRQLVLALLEGVLVYISAQVLQKGTSYVLYHRKKEPMNNEEMISAGIMTAIFVYAMPHIGIGDISPAMAISYFVVLVIGYKYGPGAGAISGAACGLAVAVTSGGMTWVGIMCILGICAGMFQENGKLWSAAAFFISSISISLLYQKGVFSITEIWEPFIAAGVFLVLPKKLLSPALEKKEKEDYVKQNIQWMAENKFKDFSTSLQKLSRSFLNYTEERSGLGCDDVNQIFEEISGQFCKDCRMCGECWNKNYEMTYAATQNMFLNAKEKGRLMQCDIPEKFVNQCIHAEKFVEETNRSLKYAAINRSWYNKLLESRQAAAGQISEMAEIVKDFASEVCEMKEVRTTKEEQLVEKLKAKHIEIKQLAIMENKYGRQEIHILARTKKGRCITTKEMAVIAGKVLNKKFKPAEQTKNIVPKEAETLVFLEDTNYKVLTGIARAVKTGEELSGDNFSFLELDSGEFVMSLCDGMGSGEAANEESRSVIDLLEDFMEAGFQEKAAIHLINSLYVLKADGNSFSTVDMGIVDLFTGSCNFVKLGAAATFIRRENEVEVISSTSFPAGMFQQVEMDGARRVLEEGEFIIMMTDGVLDCFPGEAKEEAMCSILGECKSNNPREVANYVLEKSAAASGGTVSDDMTVIVAGMWKK